MQKNARFLRSLLFCFLVFQPLAAWTQSNHSGGAQPTIIGGRPQTEDYPFMVALLRTEENDPYQAQFCGGALITPYWIVTAAHCLVNTDENDRDIVLNPEEVQVVINATDLDLVQPEERLEVDSIYIHPDYDNFSLSRDIALIRLKLPVRNYTPVPIYSPISPAIGEMARAIGWGEAEGGRFPAELREVDLPIISKSVFLGEYGYIFGPIEIDEIPAGSLINLTDTCQGDSGGPLLYWNNNQWQLTGITSWGADENCDNTRNLGIYTSVGYHQDWIAQIQNENDAASATFNQTVAMENNWFESTWFGSFQNDTTFPWIYHSNLGWTYIENGSETSTLTLFIPSIGIVTTNEETYPYFYSEDRDSWIYFLNRTQNSSTWYDLNQESRFTVSASD